jgi:nitroreductase
VTETRNAEERTSSLRSLRADRSFLPDPVPDEVVDDILRVARWSGSASNKQPWEIVVLREREMLGSSRPSRGTRGSGRGVARIVLVMAGDPAEQKVYDEGRLSERIMLAAGAHGVGPSIGWIVGSGRAAAKELLGIPPEKMARTAISLGYLDEIARRPHKGRGAARKPLSQIVHEERHG